MRGAWRGHDIPTGHPFDGLLAHYGWHGKWFGGEEDGHPMIFARPDGSRYALNPAAIPLGLLTRWPKLARRPRIPAIARAFSGITATQKPKARLRMVLHRGVVTATMIYDDLPIMDVFRTVDEATVLGAMDMRGDSAPYMFVLRRDA